MILQVVYKICTAFKMQLTSSMYHWQSSTACHSLLHQFYFLQLQLLWQQQQRHSIWIPVFPSQVSVPRSFLRTKPTRSLQLIYISSCMLQGMRGINLVMLAARPGKQLWVDPRYCQNLCPVLINLMIKVVRLISDCRPTCS